MRTKEEFIKTKEIPENAIRAQKTFSRRLKNIGKAATAFLHFQKFQLLREKKWVARMIAYSSRQPKIGK